MNYKEELKNIIKINKIAFIGYIVDRNSIKVIISKELKDAIYSNTNFRFGLFFIITDKNGFEVFKNNILPLANIIEFKNNLDKELTHKEDLPQPNRLKI